MVPCDGFSTHQIEVICQTLYQADDGEMLKRFFTENASLTILNTNFASQTVLIAYICTLLHGNKFDAMFDLLKSSRFEEKYFKELQDLWHRGRYKENETKRGKELGAVEKYRLRRKYPPPSSIWDGQETVYSFKENSRKNETKRGKELGAVEKYRLRRKYPPPSKYMFPINTVLLTFKIEYLFYSFKLRDFYEQNPYPTLDQKKEISRVTDLEIVQISNWFKNRRQRDKTSPKDVYRGTMAFQPNFPCGNLPIMNPLSLNRRIHM